MLDTTNLLSEARSLDAYWSPKVVGRVNDQYIKVAKLKGEFPKHQHDDEDELFFVLEGRLFIEFDEETVELSQGEFLVVPKGLPHRPFVQEECLIALIETVTTQHTGSLRTSMTRSIEEQLDQG